MSDYIDERQMVYCMWCPAYFDPDTILPLYKIGITNNKKQRIISISSATGVPCNFVFMFGIYIDNSINAIELEKTVHNFLSEYRFNESREFFTAPLDIIKIVFENIGGEWVEPEDRIDKSKNCKDLRKVNLPDKTEIINIISKGHIRRYNINAVNKKLLEYKINESELKYDEKYYYNKTINYNNMLISTFQLEQSGYNPNNIRFGIYSKNDNMIIYKNKKYILNDFLAEHYKDTNNKCPQTNTGHISDVLHNCYVSSNSKDISLITYMNEQSPFHHYI